MTLELMINQHRSRCSQDGPDHERCRMTRASPQQFEKGLTTKGTKTTKNDRVWPQRSQKSQRSGDPQISAD